VLVEGTGVVDKSGEALVYIDVGEPR